MLEVCMWGYLYSTHVKGEKVKDSFDFYKEYLLKHSFVSRGQQAMMDSGQILKPTALKVISCKSWDYKCLYKFRGGFNWLANKIHLIDILTK